MSSNTPKQTEENIDAAEVPLQDVPENQELAAASQPSNGMLKPKDELNSQESSDTELDEKQEAALDQEKKEKDVCQDVGSGDDDVATSGKSSPTVGFPDIGWFDCPKCNVFYSTNAAAILKHIEECKP